MSSWAPIVGLVLAAATVSLPAFARERAAPVQDGAGAKQTSDQRKAEQHFQRAKALYSSGKYREAISELEVARRLDPNAKDLVMNLAIVYEKLGQYDDAITELQKYLEMDGVTPPERAKAEGSIRRIEGAKAAAPTTEPAPEATPAPPPTPPPPARGRVDALTIGAASVAIAGLGLGTGIGLYALSKRPGDGFVTGRDGTYATLEQETADAHGAAVIADVSLGVGVVAALAAAWLYLGRTKTAPAHPAKGASGAWVSVSPPMAGTSAGVHVGGTF